MVIYQHRLLPSPLLGEEGDEVRPPSPLPQAMGRGWGRGLSQGALTNLINVKRRVEKRLIPREQLGRDVIQWIHSI